MKWLRCSLVCCMLVSGSLISAFPLFAASTARVDQEVRARLQETGQVRVIVQLHDAAAPKLSALDLRHRPTEIKQLTQRLLAAVPKLRVHRTYTRYPFIAATVDDTTLPQVVARPEVEAVFPDRVMRASLDVSGPLIGQPAAETAGYTGTDIGVAVIDTGIDYTHAAFHTPTAKFFTDVTPGMVAWRSIEAIAEHDLVAGYADNTYRPSGVVKRDQMAVFIARALCGGDANVPSGPTEASFPDVPTTYWAYKYIEYCKLHKVVQGYADGYRPSAVVTRDQMAIFIARAVSEEAERPDLPSYIPPTTASFVDVPTNYWAFKYIEFVKERGIVQGYGAGDYRPTVNCLRDQMAMFIARAFNVSWGGRVVGGVNLLYLPSDTRRNDPMDDNLHGTMVGGVVASMDTLYRGIAPTANLVAVKALDATGSGYSSDVIAGIQWCILNQAKYNIKVINLSLGDGVQWTSHESADGQPEALAIQDAVDAGIFVSCASGNEYYTEGLSLPAAASAAVSVGAVKDGGVGGLPADGITSYSDRGELLTLYAPGTWVTAPQRGSGFITEQGTSFAAPHVAGAAAVLASAGITDPLAIRDRLTSTGKQLVDSGTNVATPRVDLAKAINPPATGVDLVITGLSSSVSSAFTGDSVTFTLTVRNQGTVATVACKAVIVLSTNPDISRQDALVTTLDLPSIPAGSSTSPSLSGVIPSVTGGSYYLGAYADSNFTVPELNEVNNTKVSPTLFSVSLPSARVVSASIPTEMTAGQVYAISVTMRNDGTTTWTPGAYALQAVAPEGTTRWGTTSVALGANVDPKSATPEYTFTFDVTAPSTPGAYACHWRMVKDGAYFGEVATGSTREAVINDPTAGQDYPAASGNRVAFMDYLNGQVAGYYTRPSVSVKTYSGTGDTLVSLPMDIPGFINPSIGYPDPPFTYTDISNHYFPSISGTWVTWMVDDMPSNPSNPAASSIWYYEVLAYNLAAPSELPRRVTLQNADAWFPCVDGHYAVWEDYRNDADGIPDNTDFFLDNQDIYISDLNVITDPTNHRTAVYPLCTAPGPQFAPRLSGDIVVWEDWRDGLQGDIYRYDLSVDTDNDGIPNWKDVDRPNPDPAEVNLTQSEWAEGYPDVSGRKVVWLDYSQYTGPGGQVGIIAEDLDTLVQTPVITDPPAYRQQVRIDGTQVVWEDWRTRNADVYWSDLANPSATALIGASSVYDGVPDLGANRLAFSKFRTTGTVNGQPVDIYNVVTHLMLPYVQVNP